MYKHYIKQAWYLMKQNRFFSAVYIVGTGLAISMVMVMAVVYHIRTAGIAPEVHRARMCYVMDISYKSNDGKSQDNSGNGPRFVKEVIEHLQTPEAVAVTTIPVLMRLVAGDMFMQAPGRDEALKVSLMGCNDQFWKVYSFAFEAGKPFTEADFRSGLPRAVLAESTARRLFGTTEVMGQPLLLNEVEYLVSGVVADVSGVASDVCADVWVPYTSLSVIMDRMATEKAGSAGLLVSNVLLRDADDIGRLRDELAQEVKRYNTTLAEGKVECEEPVSYADRTVRNLFQMEAGQTYMVLVVVLLLFLLVPALNLSGLNMSNMQDRIPELGVRKAFGAPRATLLCQIFIENLLLMLPGGVAGLLFSYLLVFLFRHILLASGLYALLSGNNSIFLSAGMLFNWAVFGYAFGVCLLLNLLSSMVPAWRAVRVKIVEALNA